MSKGLEALKRNRDFIERYFVKQVEEQGIYQNDLKNQVLEDLRILEMSFYNYEQLKKVMDKYGIKTIEELEHIILNDATGEQTFKDYCGTTGHQHLNCEKLGLIKTDSGCGLVNTDLFPYDKDSDEECKKNLISNDLIKDLERLEKLDKALEIIKEKRVDVDYFIYTCVVDDWSYEDYLEEYNSTSSWFICGQRSFGYQGKEQPLLTQEEYYLLKEVLYGKETS